MLMEAVVQDIIVKNKNYEFTAREKLQHLASIIYSTKLGWIDVLRIARSQQDTFSQECKNLFSDETVELVRNRRIQECIESKLIGAYFSTAHLLSESDLQSASKEEINKKLRDAFDQKVNKWVKDTIPVYQKYAAYWAVQ